MSRILVVEVGQSLIGFMVDAVAEVIRVSPSSIQPPPSILLTNANSECFTGVINRGDRLLIVLELEQLFSDTERQAFDAMG